MRGYRIETARLAIPVRPIGALGEGQKPERPGREAGSRGGLGALMGNAPQDTRDAETIMASVESEFRRAREAQRNFLDWRKKSHEATFVEWLQHYSEMVAASEPWAASYQRIRSEFPDLMDQLHALLLPIQREILDD
jgi:hypothetical protein